MKGWREMRGKGKRKRGEKEKNLEAFCFVRFRWGRGGGTRAFSVSPRQGDFGLDTPPRTTAPKRSLPALPVKATHIYTCSRVSSFYLWCLFHFKLVPRRNAAARQLITFSTSRFSFCAQTVVLRLPLSVMGILYSTTSSSFIPWAHSKSDIFFWMSLTILPVNCFLNRIFLFNKFVRHFLILSTVSLCFETSIWITKLYCTLI